MFFIAECNILLSFPILSRAFRFSDLHSSIPQRVWGVPIPVFYDKVTDQPLLTPETVAHVQVRLPFPETISLTLTYGPAESIPHARRGRLVEAAAGGPPAARLSR